jgi:hypothetical protein
MSELHNADQWAVIISALGDATSALCGLIRLRMATVVKKGAYWISIFAFVAWTASADEIVPPPGPLLRGRTINFVYRVQPSASGKGALSIKWTDSAGRIVERRSLPVTLNGRSDVRFPLDLGRAVVMHNHLVARLTFEAPNRTAREAEKSFIVTPQVDRWLDYKIIMWQERTTLQYRALKQLGVSAGMVFWPTLKHVGLGTAITPLLDTDLRWYVENIATDFYSAYHRWTPNRPINWKFLAAKKLYHENLRSDAAFARDPGLSDPAWLKRIRDRLANTVHLFAPYRPLYYSLADEPGIAETSSFWDFDLSPSSLRGMRAWLKAQYSTLDALNREWGTAFGHWDDVTPMTTREAVARRNDNFAAWADFKTWMDVAFARALRAGTDAVHHADPNARAALEGGQTPGWGGYDYARLAGAVDVMELYDYGENVEIVRSLNPRMIVLSTVGDSGPRAAHRIWRALLRGNRGLILWDARDEFVRPDGNLGPRGRESAAYLSRIRDGIGALLIGSERHVDPIAVLYSPASFRTQWILDARPKGQAWSARDTDSEYEDNAIRVARRKFTSAIEHIGLQHRFVSPGQIADGILGRRGDRVLILPHAIALSATEAARIREFVAQGGTVVADGEPGVFDQHSRRLPKPLLSDVFRGPPDGTTQRFRYGKGTAIYLASGRISGHDLETECSRIFTAVGIGPDFLLETADGSPVRDVERYIFRNGGVTIIALQRDAPPTGSLERSGTVTLTLPKPAYIDDVMTAKSLGRHNRLTVALGPIEPAKAAEALWADRNRAPTTEPETDVGAPEAAPPNDSQPATTANGDGLGSVTHTRSSIATEHTETANA